MIKKLYHLNLICQMFLLGLPKYIFWDIVNSDFKSLGVSKLESKKKMSQRIIKTR